MILAWFSVSYQREFIDFPFWVWVGAILALFLLPISFAYAVVKHRVMEIPVLIRRSARYVLVRHAITTVGIVFGVVLTFAFAAMFSHVLPEGVAGTPDTRLSATLNGSPGGVPEAQRRALSGVAGAVFGVLITFATRSSSSELARTLDTALTAGLQDTDGFFYAASRISSSADKSRLLTDMLDKSELSSARQLDFLTSAATIESNAACAAVLDAFAAHYRVSDGPIRNAFLGALKTVDSKFERGRLLERLVTDTR
jgi:hypothetical protein